MLEIHWEWQMHIYIYIYTHIYIYIVIYNYKYITDYESHIQKSAHRMIFINSYMKIYEI